MVRTLRAQGTDALMPVLVALPGLFVPQRLNRSRKVFIGMEMAGRGTYWVLKTRISANWFPRWGTARQRILSSDTKREVRAPVAVEMVFSTV